MKVSFIIRHRDREFVRNVIKYEFYTKNCKKYSKIVRDQIFKLDFYGDYDLETIIKKERKFMVDLMHECIGEKGNYVVGLERFIKDKAYWLVDCVADSYLRKNYPGLSWNPFSHH